MDKLLPGKAEACYTVTWVSSRSEVDLSARAQHVDSIVAIAPSRGDGGVVIAHPAIIEQEADIIDRNPDQGCLKPVLDSAEGRRRVQIEMVVTQIELEGAEATLIGAHGALDAGPVPAAVAIAACLAGEEVADF